MKSATSKSKDVATSGAFLVWDVYLVDQPKGGACPLKIAMRKAGVFI